MLEYQGEVREGKVGTPLDPFQIMVKDGEGNPLPNHPLEFLVVEGKGAFSYADTSTDQTGSAIAEFVPTDGGRFRVECRVGAEQREIATFKGVVESPPAPKRRSRARTIRPPAGAPPQAAAPNASVPPPIPKPEMTPPAVTEEPPAPPTPAPVAVPAPVAAVAAPAPAAPAKPAAPAAKPAPPVPAAVRAPAAAPKAAVAAPAKSAARPQARRRQEARLSPAARGLLIAVIAITAMLAILSGILVAQETSRHPAAPAAKQGRVLQTIPAYLVSPR